MKAEIMQRVADKMRRTLYYLRGMDHGTVRF